MSKATGALPTLGVEDAKAITPEQAEEFSAYFAEVITRNVLSPAIVRENPADDELLFDDVDQDDLNFLFAQIYYISGLTGKVADEARSFREGRDEVRDASRNGEGHGGASLPVDRYQGSAPGDALRRDGMDGGEEVARGADGEGVVQHAWGPAGQGSGNREGS